MKLQGDEFRGTERFVIRRRIGSGGMGAVYEAYDRERNDTVALKTLRWHDPTAIYRLKKEFRSLSDVAHPNLVSLYELVADDEDWFYTMELVDGVDFLTYVRSHHAGARGADVARLRNTVRQLAEGVVALHRAGVLHRDLKPSNVLVTPAGRVVVLDFGVAAVVGQSASRTIDDGVWGTVAYMAPEQSAGEYGPPSDWYAVGGMLYEALTGRLPFDGTTPEILSAKARREPPPPGDLVSNLPTDLAELTSALLARKASRRPGDGEVLRRLGAIGPAPGSVAPAPAHPSVLIGRDAELEQLEEAFAAVRGGSGVATYVCGPSGIGKTSVVRCFVERLEGDGRALVLSGRCYERESVPYKALDGVVDHLSRVLKELPREEVEPLLPAEVPALARLFPVLQRVEAIALMPTPDREVAEPLERRRLAFTALRELLGRMSARRPLVVFIDDLQWADLDSVALLDDLLRPPAAPCLLLIASFRSEDMDSQPFQRRLLAHAGSPTSRVCAIGPLGPDDSARLADALLGGRPAGVEAAGVIREAAGSPFLVEQLVRYVLDSRTTSGSTSVGLAEMLDARIRTLPEGTRALLHILAIAGRPLDAKVAHVAAGLEGDERPLVNTLIAAHFLRGTAVPPRLELYHDRMRETLAGALSPGAAARAHLRLARCLEQRGFDDPEALFEHYLAAGERERAARYASRAADKALAALAFDRAALLYQRAIELVPPGGADLTTLRGCLGDALASAGRCPAAAAAYLDAARTAPPAEALEYQRRAAQQLLISGHLQEGLGVIRSVLGSVGLTLAGTPRRALVSLLLQRLWLRVRGLGFREREPHQIPAGELTRIDICWAVAVGLGLVDNIRAADFQTRHLLLALRAGDPQRVARALAVEAGFMATRGRPARRRTAQLLTTARGLAERIHSDHALALCSLMAAIRDYHEGKWESARTFAEQAERQLLSCGGGVPWELSTAQLYQAYACYHLGDVPELARRSGVFLTRARERGNLFAAYFFRSGLSNLVWLANDDVAGAQRALDDALREWDQEGFGIPHYLAMMAQAHIHLYAGRSEMAWAVVARAWPGFRRSLLMRIQGLRINGTNLRARCALAAAAGNDAQRGRLLGIAARDAKRLGREGLPWADALAMLLGAGLARGAAAVPLLRDAAGELQSANMHLHAAVARRRLGEALADDEGRALIAATDTEMAALGIRNPAAIATVFAPRSAG